MTLRGMFRFVCEFHVTCQHISGIDMPVITQIISTNQHKEKNIRIYPRLKIR